MTPEVTLAAALAALQALVFGILLWLVQRIGELTRVQNEMNGNYRAVSEWRSTHDRQDEGRFADMRIDHTEIRTEMRTRFEEVDKLRTRVTELEVQNRLSRGQ